MNILVAAAHSDDEVLGLGGSIARWTREGHSVWVLFFTDGVGSCGRSTRAVQARRLAAKRAAHVLGCRIAGFGSFPDNVLDQLPLLRLAKFVERVNARICPEQVYTHFWGDLNVDHRRVAEAVLTAFRPQPGETCRAIHAFEVASATEWGTLATAYRPNCYMELTAADVGRAEEAYAVYAEEVRPDPHSRSLAGFRARRVVRGRETGVAWAEATIICRELRLL